MVQIAVVVFPTPDELKIRADKRFKEMGKDVPQDAVSEMLGNTRKLSFLHHTIINYLFSSEL